jgi:hypothetical protein
MRKWIGAALAAVMGAGLACSSGTTSPAGKSNAADASVGMGGDDSGSPSIGGWSWDAGNGMVWIEAGTLGGDPPVDASKPTDDSGGYPLCDGGVMPAELFITQVVSFEAGACAGFGQAEMPAIVEGPPVGGGAAQGSTDVLSLGTGGSIVVAFTPNAIVDGPGVDFIVFENPFDVAGNPDNLYAEPGEVSVSNDGVTWTAFPCTATTFPYGECAGWHPVLSNPSNCVSPLDPSVAGGDPFDLHDIGVTSAKYVRIVDKANESCSSDPTQDLTTNGFDLDAIAIVNGQLP